MSLGILVVLYIISLKLIKRFSKTSDEKQDIDGTYEVQMDDSAHIVEERDEISNSLYGMDYQKLNDDLQHQVDRAFLLIVKKDQGKSKEKIRTLLRKVSLSKLISIPFSLVYLVLLGLLIANSAVCAFEFTPFDSYVPKGFLRCGKDRCSSSWTIMRDFYIASEEEKDGKVKCFCETTKNPNDPTASENAWKKISCSKECNLNSTDEIRIGFAYDQEEVELLVIKSIEVTQVEDCAGGNNDAENLYNSCNGIDTCRYDHVKRCNYWCMGNHNSAGKIKFNYETLLVQKYTNRYVMTTEFPSDITQYIIDIHSITDKFPHGFIVINNYMVPLIPSGQTGGNLFINNGLKGQALGLELKRYFGISYLDDCDKTVKYEIDEPMKYSYQNDCYFSLTGFTARDSRFCNDTHFKNCDEVDSNYKVLSEKEIMVTFSEECSLPNWFEINTPVMSFKTNKLQYCEKDCSYTIFKESYKASGLNSSCGNETSGKIIIIPESFDSNKNPTEAKVTVERKSRKFINWIILTVILCLGILVVVLIIKT